MLRSVVAWGSWRSAAQIPERRGKQTEAGVKPEAPAAALIGWLCSPNEEGWRIWWAVMLSDTSEQGLWQLADRPATEDSQGWLEVWMERQEWRRTKPKRKKERKQSGMKEKKEKLLPPRPWGAPEGAWFCLCPLLLGWHQDRRSVAARCLAPSESPAGSRSLRGHRAASALPQRVYPVAQTTRRG